MFISIKTYVIVLLIFATLLPVALLRGFMYPLIQSDFKTMAMDNLKVIGHKQTDLVNTWMHERQKDLILVSNNPYMVNSVNFTIKDSEYQKTVWYLEKIVAEYGYKGAFVCNNKGVVTLATSEERVGGNISKMDFFKQAIQGKTFVSRIIPSKISLINEFDKEKLGLSHIFVASPLKNEKKGIIGVVTLRVDVDMLSNLIQGKTYGETGETYLVGKDAYMLDESRFIKMLRKIELVGKRSVLGLKLITDNPCMVNSVNATLKDSEYQKTVRYLDRLVAECGYKGAFVCNNKGVVTLATSENRVGTNISKIDFFKQAIQGKAFVPILIPSKFPLINEFDKDDFGLPTMFIASPLKDENEVVIGVITLMVHADILSNLIHGQMYGKTGKTYLVNKDAYMLTESRFTKHLKKIGLVKKGTALELKIIEPETGELTHSVKQCLAGNVGSNSKGYNDYTGISVLGVWDWLPEFNWGVITEIDKAEAYGAAYNLKYIVIALMLIVVFPCLFVAYVFGEKLSSSIIQLKEITEEITEGDLTKKVEIKSNNEIGALVTSFNTMTKTLYEKTKETTKSEKRYREMLDTLKEGVYQCELGVEGIFTWVNQACAEMFGYNTPEEMMGRKVKSIYMNSGDTWRLSEKLEKHEICRNFASFCKKKDGEPIYTECTSNLVRNEEGDPVLIEGMIRDITGRRRIEEKLEETLERYRELFDALKEGVYQCEPGAEGVFTWVNQACAEMFGYNSPKEMIGTKVEDIYLDPEEKWRHVERLEKYGVWKNFLSFCKKKNGDHFYTERTTHLIRDKDGTPVLIEGIIRIVTERKNPE
ncbi:MAG: PAS domain S-box protein [Candidatus Scalindua sp.]|nr:PAS domain S-box protein [Candidatus Scalindua sp.]MCR4344071.1 PAS domain S-box protein [Candidatus Scalindua sp.]